MDPQNSSDTWQTLGFQHDHVVLLQFIYLLLSVSRIDPQLIHSLSVTLSLPHWCLDKMDEGQYSREGSLPERENSDNSKLVWGQLEAPLLGELATSGSFLSTESQGSLTKGFKASLTLCVWGLWRDTVLRASQGFWDQAIFTTQSENYCSRQG